MSIIVDCDSHFLPKDAFDDEEGRWRFRSRWPRFVFDAFGRDFVVFHERFRNFNAHQRSLPNEFSARKHHPGFYDSAMREAWLDNVGFDMQVLVPSPSPFAYDLEPELGLAVCRSYNNAIGRALQQHPGRFIGLAVGLLLWKSWIGR
jgi:predicted TIM-barrel fold metal-dependent hydrolase